MDAFHMDVMNTLADLKAREAKVRADNALSEIGKNNSLGELNGQKQKLVSKALSDFKADWTQARRSYSEIKAQREQVADQAAKAWDYSRLNYDRANAQSLIRAAQSPDDLREIYENLKLSGDRHALRAFAETGAVMLGGEKNFQDPAATSALRVNMYSDARRLLETPEVLAHREAERTLSDQIAKLADATKRAANEFYPSGSMYGGGNPFLELLDGVSVRQSVDPTTLSTKTIVDVSWD